MILTDEGRTRLLKRMADLDVTQRELATACGLRSHSYLGRLLRGERDRVSAEVAVRIAGFLGSGVDDFFTPAVTVVAAGIGR